jgi:hypothetical protein
MTDREAQDANNVRRALAPRKPKQGAKCRNCGAWHRRLHQVLDGVKQWRVTCSDECEAGDQVRAALRMTKCQNASCQHPCRPGGDIYCCPACRNTNDKATAR